MATVSTKKNKPEDILVAKIKLHNYRYPKDRAHVSGQYAIVVADVVEIKQGAIREGCLQANGTIVITGNMPRLEENMEYVAECKYTLDKKWGGQYVCNTINVAYNMKDPTDQKKFLSFFLSDGLISQLYNTYDNPIELLEQKNVGALTKVKGIGPATAHRICSKYTDNVQNSRAYVEFKDLGITKNAIDNLVKRFGSADAAIEIIKTNPYLLITLVRGYGWEKADKIALAQGFGRGCQQRCLAYTKYLLEKFAFDEGNSNMDIANLLEEVSKVCYPTEKEQIAQWIKERCIGQEGLDEYLKNPQSLPDTPDFFYSKDEKKIGLFHLRVIEKQIADELCRLKTAPAKRQFDKAFCSQIIAQVEEEQGYKYTHEQIRAIWNAIDNNVSILTGRAGSGKSSTLKPVIRILQHYGYDVAQCALSGRAASLLTEYTQLEGKTIHRLLRYLPEEERFCYSKHNKLPQTAIILDETSMVGEELFYMLISAIENGSKLIMLGDIKQLPPISVGNILSDCIKSGYIPTVSLTIIQRQAAQSGIITQAAKVCEGSAIIKSDFEGFEIRGDLRDFKIEGHADNLLVHKGVIDEYKRFISEGIDPDDIQIVAPVRSRGYNSCRYFNAEIQEIVNAGNKNKKEVTFTMTDNGQTFDVKFRVGDRIIVMKNNYHARTLDGGEMAIFNGNMGHIVDLDNESVIIDINDEGQIVIPRENWYDISLSYACTAHKMQGSQAKNVIVVLDNSAHTLLMREWLYTAITRARKYCSVIGQPKAINTATRISDIKLKRTWLKNDLAAMYSAEH